MRLSELANGTAASNGNGSATTAATDTARAGP